jgi:hypothetical protein
MNFGTGRSLQIAAVLLVVTFLSAGSLHSIVQHSHSESGYAAEIADTGHCHEGEGGAGENPVWALIHCSLARDAKKALSLILPVQFEDRVVELTAGNATTFFIVHIRTRLPSYEKQLARGVFAYTRFG